LRRLNQELDERVVEQTRLLSEQMAELETLYGQLPLGVGFLDTELRFVRANKQLASLNSIMVGTQAGRAVREIVSEELESVIVPLQQRVLATGDAILDHEVPVAGAGTSAARFWSISCSPVTRDERLLGVQVIVQDITERRRAEEALSQSNASLRRANEALEQFAYTASHDLQEPLRSVAIYSQLLKKRFEGALGPEGDMFIGYTVQGALRMEQLVRDLLAYTQASGAVTAELVSVKEAVAQALSNLDMAIQESEATITASELPEITLPRVHLIQLFQNLIGNSIKYRKPGPPRIHISAVSHQGDSWLFAVEDNGIGIDPEYHQRVFGIFRRLHGNDEHPGTGIGLAMCRRIVEQNGGRIWVDSKAGEGATFCFTLPAATMRNGDFKVGALSSGNV
jgi:PAS domain S-box-containing protein